MATKRKGVACYEKAGMDEPIFVLRARDELAASLVRQWATWAARGGTRQEVIDEAEECAKAMDAWPEHKWPGTSVERHEDYPGQAYFHENNPNIKRAEDASRESLQKQLDDALAWIRVVSEDLVNAGGQPGDRTVALENLRAILKGINIMRGQQ